MNATRVRLKTRLIQERGQLCGLNGVMLSQTEPYCLHSTNGLDLHETIITRGDVRGNDRLIQAVTEAEWNVSLLNHDCHMRHGAKSIVLDDGAPNRVRDYLTEQLLRRYGLFTILQGIRGLGMKNPGPYLAYVQGIHKETV